MGSLYRRTFKRLDKADQRRQRGAKFMACVGDEIDAHLFGRAQGRAIDDAYRLLVVSDGVGKQFPPLILSARIEERSEEHTSELQSLMRNSYAVFCLKQKKHIHARTSVH